MIYPLVEHNLIIKYYSNQVKNNRNTIPGIKKLTKSS
jgi:hypothetical protein